MSHEVVGRLIDRWMQDAVFRAAMRKDMDQAVRSAGIVLTQEEWTTLRTVDWRMNDEELRARVSKVA